METILSIVLVLLFIVVYLFTENDIKKIERKLNFKMMKTDIFGNEKEFVFDLSEFSFEVQKAVNYLVSQDKKAKKLYEKLGYAYSEEHGWEKKEERNKREFDAIWSKTDLMKPVKKTRNLKKNIKK